jgi:hypothetical protein
VTQGPADLANNGSGPRVSPPIKMKTYQLPDLIDLAALACPKRHHRSTPLETAGLGGIRSCPPVFSLSPFGFKGSSSKLCWLLISWGTFSFYSSGGECYESRDLRTSDGGSTPVAMRNWLGDS